MSVGCTDLYVSNNVYASKIKPYADSTVVEIEGFSPSSITLPSIVSDPPESGKTLIFVDQTNNSALSTRSLAGIKPIVFTQNNDPYNPKFGSIETTSNTTSEVSYKSSDNSQYIARVKADVLYGNRTYKLQDIGVDCDIELSCMKSQIINSNLTLNGQQDLDSLYFCDMMGVGMFTVTMPQPLIGARYKFIIKSPNMTSGMIIDCGANKLVLYANSNDGQPVNVSGGLRNIMFVSPYFTVGDSLDVYSDGYKWYARGFCANHLAIASS